MSQQENQPRRQPRQGRQSRERPKSKSKSKFRFRFSFTKYSVVMSILFLIIVVPILLGIVGLGGYGTKFSIYNESWDGLSNLRLALEGEGYTNITNGMSSLSLLNRVYEPGVLAIMGPATQYSTTDTISLITFLARGGSVIVADDYGTGAEIFEPLFNIMNTWDDIAAISGIPSLMDMFGFGSNESEGVTEQTLIFEMLGMLKGFAFNGSVLMDAESYTTNPAQPLLVNYESTNPLTAGISRGVQMEFGTVLSIAVNHSEYIDSGSTELVKVYQTDWMPLQAVSLELFGFEIENQFLPFLPFYTTQSAWMESDFQAARKGDATPDTSEWGNVMFAPMMTIPIGLGKIIMIGDPDIFINKWIDYDNAEWNVNLPPGYENDNLQFSLNLFDYATEGLNVTGDPRTAPIIFDEGHAHQKFYSSSVYSMTIMRLITEMSMFPLYSPFMPIIFGIIGYKLIPKKTRLTPILWTKYRGEKGRSRFEREIRRIVDTGAFSEAVGLLYRSLLRGLRKVSKQSMSTPEEIAEYFSERDTSLRYRVLIETLIRIDAYLARPHVLPEHVFMKYMSFIKGLIDRLHSI